MRTTLSRATLLALVPALLSMPVHADADIRTQRVQFARGASSAVVEGTITGYQAVDYVLAAAEGQYMNVSMATDNAASYFNILAPGETEVAFFNGSTSENQYEGILPANGDYRIRVYMMRSAARRNETANHRLEVIVTGNPRAPSSKNPDAAGATVATAGAGGGFDATGKLPCASHRGQPMSQCDFGVSRTGSGDARVVISRPDGSTRTIYFVKGRATGADSGPATGGPGFNVEREDDLNLIRVGDERYEVPDAVVNGG